MKNRRIGDISGSYECNLKLLFAELFTSTTRNGIADKGMGLKYDQ
jgi:hypothetical protein